MESLKSLYDETLNVEWGKLVLEEQERRYLPLLQMDTEVWTQWARHCVQTSPNPRKVIPFLDFIESLRRLYISPAMRIPTPPPTPDTLQLDMDLLEHMVDEPEKYGDDIVEALELEQQLLQTRKAWRVRAMWIRKEDEERDAKALACEQTKYIAATKIQAVWRGFETRCSQRWTDCARCLCHRVSYWMIGGPDGVCEDCYNEVRYGCTTMEEEDCPFECEAHWDATESVNERAEEEEEVPVCDYCGVRRPGAYVNYCNRCYYDEKLYKYERDD